MTECNYKPRVRLTAIVPLFDVCRIRHGYTLWTWTFWLN